MLVDELEDPSLCGQMRNLTVVGWVAPQGESLRFESPRVFKPVHPQHCLLPVRT